MLFCVCWCWANLERVYMKLCTPVPSQVTLKTIVSEVSPLTCYTEHIWTCFLKYVIGIYFNISLSTPSIWELIHSFISYLVLNPRLYSRGWNCWWWHLGTLAWPAGQLKCYTSHTAQSIESLANFSSSQNHFFFFLNPKNFTWLLVPYLLCTGFIPQTTHMKHVVSMSRRDRFLKLTV